MPDAKEAEFSLNVMINKEESRVLFAESDSHFADILLSFLTLPLGRIIKVLEKHYVDEAPTIGSLSSLYHSLVDLDSAHFWTQGAKQTLLNPASSFIAEYERLKLDLCDYQRAEYFRCIKCNNNKFRSVSVYYDNANKCQKCKPRYIQMILEVDRGEEEDVCEEESEEESEEEEDVCEEESEEEEDVCEEESEEEEDEKESQTVSGDGVFTINTTSFIISDDLQILPNETGLLGIISILGITDADKAEPIKVTFGFSEIMSLLKASLISQTPFSDLILNKTRHANSVAVGCEPETSSNQIEDEENPESKKMTLKVMVQKSTGKLLYAQAKEDFVEFLFSFLNIPLGGVEHLLAGKTFVRAINNLHRSTTDLIDDEYFKTPDTKNRLIKPNVAHGCISKNNILPLTEECLPAQYGDVSWSSSIKFPNGQGSYIKGSRTYKVTDDLTVTPFCIVSILSDLNKQKILMSDIEELVLQIGLKEALSILRASLTSTSALTDALLTHMSIKQPKPEI